MKKKQVIDISTKVLAYGLAFSLVVSANSIQLGTQADSMGVIGQSEYAQSVESDVPEYNIAANAANISGETLGDQAITPDSQSNTRAAVQPLAITEDGAYEYFPVTMYNYDAKTYNYATHNLEIQEPMTADMWQGFYFMDTYQNYFLKQVVPARVLEAPVQGERANVNLANGKYILYNPSTGEAIGVDGDNNLKAAEDLSTATEWIITKTENGGYTLRNSKGQYMSMWYGTGVVVDVAGDDVPMEFTIASHTTENRVDGVLQGHVYGNADGVELCIPAPEGSQEQFYWLNAANVNNEVFFRGYNWPDARNAFYLYQVDYDAYVTEKVEEAELHFDDKGNATIKDGEYVLINTRKKKAVELAEVAEEDGSMLLKSNTVYVNNWTDKVKCTLATTWTITNVEGGYTIQDQYGRYMDIADGKGTVSDNEVVYTVTQNTSDYDAGDDYEYQANAVALGVNGYYLNDTGGNAYNDPHFKGYNAVKDAGSAFILYKVNKEINKYYGRDYDRWDQYLGGPNVWSGIVQDELVNGNIIFNHTEAGVFDSSTELKNIYTNVGLPFVYDAETYTYTFDSNAIGARFDGEPKSDTNLKISDEPQKMENGTSIWLPFNDEDAVNNADYFFGMVATIPLTMTANGKISPTNEDSDHIKFTFEGDDDVWVFIDGKLVLDLGGIHDSVGGEIDFAENTWKLTSSNNKPTINENEEFVEGKIFTQGEDVGIFTESRESYAAKENHQLTIFYLERGAGLSNCKISFNFPMQDTVAVTKRANRSIEVDENGEQIGEPAPVTTGEQANIDNMDFIFKLYKKADGTDDYVPVSNTNFYLEDANGVVIDNRSTDTNGEFALRNGQTARFVTDLAGNNSYYVEERPKQGFSRTSYTYFGSATEGFAYGDIINGATGDFEPIPDLNSIGTGLMVNGENSIKSDKIIVKGGDDKDSIQFVCENYLDASMPSPSIHPNDDVIVIDYGLGVKIEPLLNDLWRGDSIKLTDVSEGKYGVATIEEGTNVITYKLNQMLSDIETLTYSVEVTGTSDTGEIQTTTETGTVRIIPATQMYYEEDFGDIVTYKQGKAENDWQVIGTPETDYQEPGRVGTNTDSPYGSDDAYESDGGDSNGSSMYVDTDKGAAQFSYTFTGTGTAFLSRMCDTSGYMRVVLNKQKYVWGTNDQYGTATITDTSSADGKGIVFRNFQTNYWHNDDYGNNSTWEGQAALNDIEVTQNSQYQVEFDVKSSKAKKVLVQTLSNGVYTTIGTVDATDEQKKVSFPFAPGADKVKITLAFGAMSESESGTYDIEFSNLKLYKVDGENVTEVPLDEQVEKLFRNTYYKDGTDAENDVVLYNIPVYNREDLEYGTYSVTVTIAKNFYNGKNNAGEKVYGNEFWLDGIRVYNPLGTGSQVPTEANSAYSADGEANNTVVTLRDKLIKDVTSTDAEGNLIWKDEFVLFTDTNGQMVSASDYKSIGPKEEVYLNSGQSISFSLANWDANLSKVYLGIKAPFGSGIVNINNQEYVINNAADCYYVINPDIREVDGKKYADFVITAAEGSLISLTNVKVTGSAQFTIYDVSGAEDVDWSSIDYIASSDPATAVNQYKIVVASGAVEQVVNIQPVNNNNNNEMGIYVLFKDINLGNITVNGQVLAANGAGAGRYLTLSSLNKKYNTVVVYDSQGTEKTVLYVYNEKGVN